MLHIATGKIEPIETKVFLALISSFSARTHRLPKYMVLADGVAPPLYIFSIDDDDNKPETFSDGADSKVAVVYYKPRKNQTDQMKKHEQVRSLQFYSMNNCKK